MKERNRYLKIVEWSGEDQCYIGSVPGWIGKCCHGDNEEKVYRELCQIVDEWIEIYAKDGRPLPPATSGKKYSAANKYEELRRGLTPSGFAFASSTSWAVA